MGTTLVFVKQKPPVEWTLTSIQVQMSSAPEPTGSCKLITAATTMSSTLYQEQASSKISASQDCSATNLSSHVLPYCR